MGLSTILQVLILIRPSGIAICLKVTVAYHMGMRFLDSTSPLGNGKIWLNHQENVSCCSYPPRAGHHVPILSFKAKFAQPESHPLSYL